MNTGLNQKTKFIVFGCLVVIFIVVVVYRILGSHPKKVPTKLATTQPAQAQKDRTSVAPGGLVAWTYSVGKSRDPFMPRVPSNSEVVSSHSTMPSLNSFLGSKSGLPFAPISAPAELRIQNPVVTVEDDPIRNLLVTGIIRGHPNVAIIRSSGATRFIVREGQRVDGKYEVESITPSGVWLRYNNRNYFVRLGEQRQSGTVGNDVTSNGSS